MFIRVEGAVLILIEDSHKLAQGPNLSVSIQIRLVLLENILEDFLAEVFSCDIIFGKSTPN